jgi:pre-mycofactocin synthase
VLDAYRLSIDRTLIALGKSSISELSPDDLVIPEGYFLKHTEPLPMAAR